MNCTYSPMDSCPSMINSPPIKTTSVAEMRTIKLGIGEINPERQTKLKCVFT